MARFVSLLCALSYLSSLRTVKSVVHHRISNLTLSGSGKPYQLDMLEYPECKHTAVYKVHEQTQVTICLALNDSMLALMDTDGREVLKNGYASSCKVSQLMLWMLATSSGGYLADNVVIDAGAGVGACTVCLSAMGLHVIAVESSLQNISMIHASKKLNHFLSIHVTHGIIRGNTSLVENHISPLRSNHRQFHEISLHSVIPEHRHIVLMQLRKCDLNCMISVGRKWHTIQMIRIKFDEYIGKKNITDIFDYLIERNYVILIDPTFEISKNDFPIEQFFDFKAVGTSRQVADSGVLYMAAKVLLNQHYDYNNSKEVKSNFLSQRDVDVLVIKKELYAKMVLYFNAHV